jgi:hypothetical protein
MTAEVPTLREVLTATVTIGAMVKLGTGPGGERRLIPILGGHFTGPRLRGRVLPGVDRQLIATPDLKLLDAVYELETDDGVVLTVRNRVKVISAAQPSPRPLSHADVAAPFGAYAWLNRAVLVGRLTPPEGGTAAVVVELFELCDG